MSTTTASPWPAGSTPSSITRPARQPGHDPHALAHRPGPAARYRHARHIIQNERKVTRIVGSYKGDLFPYYVVQIAGRSVNGIDSYVKPGEEVDKGNIFGMIRIGSQVDLVVPYRPGLTVQTSRGPGCGPAKRFWLLD